MDHKKILTGLIITALSVYLAPLSAQEGSEVSPMPPALEQYMLQRVVPVPEDEAVSPVSPSGLGTLSTGADGEDNPLAPYAEKSILPKLKVEESVTAETTELLGERIDLNTGSVSFHHTDISLPGNSALEVAIRRTYRGNYFSFLNIKGVRSKLNHILLFYMIFYLFFNNSLHYPHSRHGHANL